MKKQQELISIIVPVYNVELYLRRCVDSIIEQSYKNLDIILVDDGSTDSCSSICDEYLSIDSRISVIHKKNGGLSDARNHGMPSARGEFITFIDSDDWVVSDFIEHLYSLILEYKADISICSFQKTFEYPAKPIIESKEIVKRYTNIEALSELNGKHGTLLVSAWSKLYKRSLFEGISYPLGKIHEDDFTTYKLLYKANNIVLSPKVGLFYWQRSDSITSTPSLKAQADKLEASIERFHFFNTLKFSKLNSIGARSMFHNYINYEYLLRMNKVDDCQFNAKTILNDLRKNIQTGLFKYFYEIYFISPKFGWFIYKKIIKPLILKPKYNQG